MPAITDAFFREQLLDRRQRLTSAAARSREQTRLTELLSEVDAALARMDEGTYGICEVCHDTVEASRLLANPLARYCLDHLTAAERSALERDLELAASLQRGLLPRPETSHNGWHISYAYRPLGAVSGDYCDLVKDEGSDAGFFFFVGDVSGKGVPASMLTAQLHAIFRSLVARQLAVAQLVQQAGRIFCESSLSPYFVTLVGGRAGAGGLLEVSNAGHCPPLLVGANEVTRVEPSGVPLGMSTDGDYRAEQLTLNPGEVVVIYTDGLSEARNSRDEEYGEARVIESLIGRAQLGTRSLVQACLDSLAKFLANAPLADDLTIMAIQRTV
ncbi:MAG TPA: SpoIIE family protein phosphatase [Terriglobia bacterium]|nr:SpoIIE family protein phosphatase [Terriglobia bacterium]